MANVVLSWPANPPEEGVTGYNVFMDGSQVGTTPSPGFTIPNVPAGIHEISVAAVNVWGQGPMSDPAGTPAGASKVGGISISINVA